eukprot:GHVO01013061.1.p2 GENE.GHVO01013061.1~~GHVO01013061.1.p2  ORF type:complete len:103 (+),score=13.30 GHVO01013061.1:249-557(+)
MAGDYFGPNALMELDSFEKQGPRPASYDAEYVKFVLLSLNRLDTVFKSEVLPAQMRFQQLSSSFPRTDTPCQTQAECDALQSVSAFLSAQNSKGGEHMRNFA